MRNNVINLWSIIIALIGGIILFVVINNNQTILVVKNTNISAVKSPTNTTIVNKPTPSNTTNTANKAASVKQAATMLTYTIVDLSKHNSKSSCWTAVSGNIYDITSFVSSHPAGVNKIMQGCGIDATKMYGRVGAHDVSRLTNYIVGILK